MTDLLSTEAMIEAAAHLAGTAHQGQYDKADRPYIEHPAAVAERCRYNYAYDPHLIAAAWLHDVVEDTLITIEDLEDKGFSPQTLRAVEAVTRREGEDYLNEFIPRVVSAGQRAIRLKRADISHNTSPSRQTSLPARLAKRYEAADALLMVAESKTLQKAEV